MEIINLNNAEKVAPSLDAYRMFQNEKTELIHLQLKAGEILHRHTNPNDVIFYVLDGEGELTVEKSIQKLTKDSCTKVAANLNREWKNTGDTLLKLLVIKQF